MANMAVCERAYVAKHPMSCEACGHNIKECFVVRLETGVTLTVGSACVLTLCSDSEGARMVTRMKRAARQWRDQCPAPREGESREDYISRRIAEMGNARAAYVAWQGMRAHGAFGDKTQRNAAIQRLADRGIVSPYAEIRAHLRIHGGCWSSESGLHLPCEQCTTLRYRDEAYPGVVEREVAAMRSEVAREHHANPFDFANAKPWEIAKM